MRCTGWITWEPVSNIVIGKEEIESIAHQMKGKPVTVNFGHTVIGLVHDTTVIEGKGIALDVELYDVKVGVILHSEKTKKLTGVRMELIEVSLEKRGEKVAAKID